MKQCKYSFSFDEKSAREGLLHSLQHLLMYVLHCADNLITHVNPQTPSLSHSQLQFIRN